MMDNLFKLNSLIFFLLIYLFDIILSYLIHIVLLFLYNTEYSYRIYKNSI